MSAAELWGRLRADGLVEGDPPEAARFASPWYVRTILGIAGWIGSLFLMGFVGAGFAFIIQDTASATLLGAACCAAAYALFRKFDGNDFVEQFALVISLVGQILIVVGLAQTFRLEDPALYLIVALVQAGLALAVPNFLHRVLASCGAAVALALAINQLRLHGFAAPILGLGLALVWLEPRRWAAAGPIWRPVGYGLALALLLVETTRLFGAEALFGMISAPLGLTALYGPLIGRGLTAAILVWAAFALAAREGHPPGSRVSLAAAAAALLFGVLSLGAPGLASAALILLLGFAAGNRLLAALGILALLGFVSHYYYSLHFTLLEKSGLMALTGLLLLAAHLLLRRFVPPSAAGEAANA